MTRWLREIQHQLYGLCASLQSAKVVNISLYGDPKNGSADPATATAEFARGLGLLTEVSGFESIWERDTLLSTLDPELAGGRPAMPHSLYGFLMHLASSFRTRKCVALSRWSIRCWSSLDALYASQTEGFSGSVDARSHTFQLRILTSVTFASAIGQRPS